MLAVRAFIHYVSNHSFVPFAWYRIVFGGLILMTAYFGWIDWSDA
jgi:undecaprenyl-diphosphatase